MGRTRSNNALLKRVIPLGVAGFLIFAAGISAGMLTDGVSQLLISYHMSQAEPEPAAEPNPGPQAKFAQAAAFSPPQTMNPSAPDQPRAWFPANNHITWHASIAPETRLATLRLYNGDLDQNRIVRLHAGSHQSRSMWQPLATLYIRPGQAADVQLPLAHYMLSSSTSPTEMAIDAALRRPLSPMAQVTLLYPKSGRDPAIELALDTTSGVTLIADRRPPAPSIRQPRKSPSLAQQRVPSQQAHEQEPPADYGELIQAALAGQS